VRETEFKIAKVKLSKFVPNFMKIYQFIKKDYSDGHYNNIGLYSVNDIKIN